MKKKLITLLLLVLAVCVMLGAAAEELKSIYNSSIFLVSSQCWRTSSMLAENDDEADYVKGAITFIEYRDGEYRTAKDDRRQVVDGGTYSAKKTFDVGTGCGLTDEDLWYITFTFNKNTTTKTILYNTNALVFSTSRVTYLGKDVKEYAQNAEDLTRVLLESKENIAIEVDEKIVLFKKGIGDGKIIVGVNSKEFYDLFYKGTIENYYTIDFEE